MRNYLDLVQKVLDKGIEREDRTKVGTLSLFGEKLVFNNIWDNFPLVTTKKVNWTSVVQELLWFIKGETNIKTLGNHIWDEWADKDGNLGPIYGYQWRNWGGDQLIKLIEGLKKDPFGRRHILSAWNVDDIPKMALPPCHILAQFYVRRDYLDCQLYQRSADLALGVPFNIASYALLTTLIGNETRLTPGNFHHVFGDVHIYKNHIEGLKTQLEREPLTSPIIFLPDKKVVDMEEKDIVLYNYEYHPPIKFDVAV